MNINNTPLASRMRPRTLDEIVGQTHLLAKGKIVRQAIENDTLSSMIFWGPPGVGKTTLAKILAAQTKSAFVDCSAVTSGVKELREILVQAEKIRQIGGKTLLFVDEIHRFNKAQQDIFLPYVEKGSVILVGATTENPSFEINSALLSRCRVFVLKPLTVEELVSLMKLAIKDERGFKQYFIEMSEDMLKMVANFSNGDARVALNTLEMLILNAKKEGNKITITDQDLKMCLNKKTLLYDKNNEEHYNIISALHKSMRNSDVDASIYWLARMLESGENPLYIARRCLRFASEDIGMADSRALEICVAAYHACHFIGMPECSVHLSHAVTYLALAPKSNALYLAYESAKEDALNQIAEPVPLALRNAPTELMKELNYGKGYQYAHDSEDKITNLQCLPDSLANREYYFPTTQGSEIKVQERMKAIKNWKKKHQ